MLTLLKVGSSATTASHLGGRGAEGMGSSMTAAPLFGGTSAEVALQQALLCLFFTDYLLGNRCTHTRTGWHSCSSVVPRPNAVWLVCCGSCHHLGHHAGINTRGVNPSNWPVGSRFNEIVMTCKLQILCRSFTSLCMHWADVAL